MDTPTCISMVDTNTIILGKMAFSAALRVAAEYIYTRTVNYSYAAYSDAISKLPYFKLVSTNSVMSVPKHM